MLYDSDIKQSYYITLYMTNLYDIHVHLYISCLVQKSQICHCIKSYNLFSSQISYCNQFVYIIYKILKTYDPEYITMLS